MRKGERGKNKSPGKTAGGKIVPSNVGVSHLRQDWKKRAPKRTLQKDLRLRDAESTKKGQDGLESRPGPGAKRPLPLGAPKEPQKKPEDRDTERRSTETPDVTQGPPTWARFANRTRKGGEHRRDPELI